MGKKYYSCYEVAELSNMSHSMVSNYAKTHNIMRWGKSYMWTEEELQIYKSRVGQRAKKGEGRRKKYQSKKSK